MKKSKLSNTYFLLQEKLKHKIFQLEYYERNQRNVLWSTNKDELIQQIEEWKERGFGVAEDEINQISYSNKEELCEQLNNLQRIL